MVDTILDKQANKKFADLAEIAGMVQVALKFQEIAFDAVSGIEDNSIRQFAAERILSAAYDLNQYLSNQLQVSHDNLYEEV